MNVLPRNVLRVVASGLGPRNQARLAVASRTARNGVANHRAARAPAVRARWRAVRNGVAKVRRDARFLTIKGLNLVADFRAGLEHVPQFYSMIAGQRGDMVVKFTNWLPGLSFLDIKNWSNGQAVRVVLTTTSWYMMPSESVMAEGVLDALQVTA